MACWIFIKIAMNKDRAISNLRRLVETPTGAALPWAVSSPPASSTAMRNLIPIGFEMHPIKPVDLFPIFNWYDA